MSKNTVLVHTQYEENYAHYEGGFHWKKKGGHTFQIEMDADHIFYSDPAKVFSKMLESHNSDMERFTYVDHEIQYQTPTLLGTQADYLKANQDLFKGASLEKIKGGVIGGVDFTESIDQLNNLSIL